MPTVTFRSLLNRVAYVSGEVIAPDGRNAVAMVAELMNTELEQYHDAVLEHSDRALRRAVLTTSASTTVGADGFPANERVALPTGFGALRAASLLDGTVWRPLKRLSEHMRSLNLDLTGVPREASVATGADGSNVLRLSPPSDGAYSVEVLYLPTVTAATLDASVELLPGGDDWIVYGTALRVMQANGANEPGAVALAREMYMAAVQHVRNFASKQDRNGPSAMRETDRDDLNERAHRWLIRGW